MGGYAQVPRSTPQTTLGPPARPLQRYFWAFSGGYKGGTAGWSGELPLTSLVRFRQYCCFGSKSAAHYSLASSESAKPLSALTKSQCLACPSSREPAHPPTSTLSLPSALLSLSAPSPALRGIVTAITWAFRLGCAGLLLRVPFSTCARSRGRGLPSAHPTCKTEPLATYVQATYRNRQLAAFSQVTRRAGPRNGGLLPFSVSLLRMSLSCLAIPFYSRCAQ